MRRHEARRHSSSPGGIAEDSERVHAKKGFGQHFLTDLHILSKIVQAAEVVPGDVVLEIGPGLGHLTHALLDAGAHVVAIEIDPELVTRLRDSDPTNPRLSILEGDFLTARPDEWLRMAGIEPTRYKVVANLPYYITSAILRHLLESSLQPTVIVVMVQREVAQQITAQPPDMSLLAVSVQFYGVTRNMGIVPAGAFNPRPKVDSAIVRVLVSTPSRLPDVDPARFFKIVRAGFSVRRKQLHNALEHGLGLTPSEANAVLMRAAIDPRRRAETLALAEWRQVYDQFSRLKRN